MTRDIIIKFLNNRCTEAELDEVVRWANTEEALTGEGMAWGINDWSSYQMDDDSGDDEKFSALFDKIERRIDAGIDQHRQAGAPSLLAWLTKAAAILLFPVLTLLLYTFSELKTESKKYAALTVDTLEITAPVGGRTVVRLPDGSEVHLNYDSKIRYPRFFSGDTRDIRLTGEGYFKVAPDPEKPFVVKTGKLNIKALGTVFNVLAYPGQDIVETTLVNGKVVLEQDNENGRTRTIGYMAPGQHVRYDTTTDAVSGTQGNIEPYIAWKDGKLVFEDATTVQVAEKLSRMFNVDIEIADDARDTKYSVTFVNETLFQILDLMTIATPVQYQAFPREILPDGTFSKQKIIISKKY